MLRTVVQVLEQSCAPVQRVKRQVARSPSQRMPVTGIVSKQQRQFGDELSALLSDRETDSLVAGVNIVFVVRCVRTDVATTRIEMCSVKRIDRALGSCHMSMWNPVWVGVGIVGLHLVGKLMWCVLSSELMSRNGPGFICDGTMKFIRQVTASDS